MMRMRTIDARTGRDVREGDTLGHDDAAYRVLTITPGVFQAFMLVERSDGSRQVVPLVVRWMHPSFFGQHVGFVPS